MLVTPSGWNCERNWPEAAAWSSFSPLRRGTVFWSCEAIWVRVRPSRNRTLV